MKKTFLENDKPFLCAMIHFPTPEECIERIKAAIAGGADAICVQLSKLKKEYRTKEIITEIFNACGDLPIYVTSYPQSESSDYTDEECTELLLLGVDCGGTLFDVRGDLFDRGAKYELTTNPEAVEKQKKLIDEIHRRGGEVLISCHTGSAPTLEENLMIAHAQKERGADVIKIVNVAKDSSYVPVCIESIQKIIKETGKKLLFLGSEEAQVIRFIGANFGVCMYLCYENENILNVKQPLSLKHMKTIRENLYFKV